MSSEWRDSPIEPEPHNLKNSVCVTYDKVGDQVGQEREKLKDQGGGGGRN